jgi:hypothetical protein
LIRSKPLRRSKPLERRTRMRQRRATPRRSERTRDPARRAWTRRQPCCARDVPGHRCYGRVEGDHAGERPVGRKADDDTMIALCQQGHVDRAGFAGAWREWDGDRMRLWLDEQIADHQRRYAVHLEREQRYSPGWGWRMGTG